MVAARGLLLLAVLAATSAPAADPEPPPGAGDGLPPAYLACVPVGDSAACAELLAAPCLAAAADAAALTACRARLADALDARVAALIADHGRRSPADRARALELAAGADRHIGEYCARLVATPGDDAHGTRCRLMASHLKFYHLSRGLTGGQEI